MNTARWRWIHRHSSASICLVMWFLFLAPILHAGTFTAELDRTEGTLQDYFVLTINIEGKLSESLELPKVPGLEFHVKSRRESSQFMNGGWSKHVQLGVMIQAERPGEYVIPSMQLTIDGEKVATLPLTLNVLGDPAAAQGGQSQSQGNDQNIDSDEQKTQPQGAQSSESLKNQIAAQQREARKNLSKTGGLFINRQCEPPSVYVGQQIVCTVRLYHPGNLNSGQPIPENSAEFRRFGPLGERRDQAVINGQRFAVIELTEVFVPLKEGNLRIPSFQLEAQVVSWEQRKNPLDHFFDRFGGGMFDFDFSFPDTKILRLSHPENQVEVKPLPRENQPSNFKSLVGSYEMAASLSHNSVKVGDTVTLTVTVAGMGVLDTAAPPDLTLDPTIKTYVDKPEYSERVEPGKGIFSQKVFKLALVPAKQGSFSLGQVQIPIFDPSEGQYRILAQDLASLIVTPGQAEEKLFSTGQSEEPSKKQVRQVGQDLFGPHSVPEMLGSDQLTSTEKVVVAAGIGLGVFAPLISLGVQQALRRRRDDVGGLRRSRARKRLRAGLDVARESIKAGASAQGVSTIYRGFREFLGDLKNTHGQALTLRDMEGIFEERLSSADRIGQARDLIRKLEVVEFRGGSPSQDEALMWLEEVDVLAGELER